MFYYLMRKDETVATLNISGDGDILKIGRIHNRELIPLQGKTDISRVREWWRDRAIPIKQGKIAEMLQKSGFPTTEAYLMQNLGLSLTDYYWIRPLDSSLTWGQVNLFDNDFKENLLVDNPRLNKDDSENIEYQPNSSLQGNLEKTWIIDNGIRKLIKGNHGELSSESINEVLISDAIKRLGRNAATYELLHIKDKPYDFGCISPLFTSQELELVSAYAVLNSEDKPNNLSTYEHFIHVCHQNGLDKDIVREYLEFEILIDFIFSNRDRHFTNISILRDADTLKFVSMAPYFDAGKSLMVGKDITKNITYKYLLNQETLGFKNKEFDLLKLVQNRNLIDINLLPDTNAIAELYAKDTKVSDERIHFACAVYEAKIDLYDKFKSGQDLNALRFSTNIAVEQKDTVDFER